MKNKTDRELAVQFLAVVPRAMRVIRQQMRALARPSFSVPHFRIMGRLYRGPATASELAEIQGVSMPAMSRMVDSLVKRGYLERTQTSRDRRHIHLHHSKKGRLEFERIRRIVQSHLAESVSMLKPADKKALKTGLEILGGMVP